MLNEVRDTSGLSGGIGYTRGKEPLIIYIII